MEYTRDIGEFFRKNNEELRRMVYSICSYYGVSCHKKILSDVYIRLIEGRILERFDPSLSRISTYIFSVIQNIVRVYKKSNEFRVYHSRLVLDRWDDDSYKSSDCDELELILRVSQVSLEYQNLIDRNKHTDDTDGLRFELDHFERYLEKKNKKYSLRKRKYPHIQTNGCSLLSVYQYLRMGLNNRQIATIYGCSNMFVSNLKNQIRAIMIRYGINYGRQKYRPQRSRKRYGSNKMSKVSRRARNF